MEIISGRLTVKMSTVLKTKMHSNVWCILYNGRSSFSPRIGLFEDNKNVDNLSCKKTIYIEEAKWRKIDSLEPAFSFEVKHSKQYTFITASESDLKVWILALCCLSKDLFNTKYILGVEDLDKMDTSFLMGEQTVVQNILYSSSSDISTFIVVADQTGACLQRGLKGPYKLRISQGVIQILQHDSEREVLHCSLLTLKSYGHSASTFSMECGSRSMAGAGRFTFYTTEGDRITHMLQNQAEMLYKKNSNPDTATVKTASSITSASYTQASTVKAKPPVTPLKSAFYKNSSIDSKLQEDVSQFMCEQQLPKRGMPLLGIPVLPTQLSNMQISDDVTPSGENGTSNRDRLNSWEVTVNSQMADSKQHLLLGRSVSSQSVETVDKKDSKKIQKEKKKELKKREEEEKKERKRREEEMRKEQKRKEEEEKKIRKEQKKAKMKSVKTHSASSKPSSSSSEPMTPCSEYAEAGDFSTSSYTEINLARATPCATSTSAYSVVDQMNSEKIYSEPWGSLPIMPMLPVGGEGEVEYATPEKRPPVTKTASIEPREVIHTENYEAFHTEDSEIDAPPFIPSSQEEEDNTYSHLNQNQSRVTTEHIYGITSATLISEEENPYEDTNISTYETVG